MVGLHMVGLSVSITEPASIERSSTIHRSPPPPKFGGGKPKTTTKVILASRQQALSELLVQYVYKIYDFL